MKKWYQSFKRYKSGRILAAILTVILAVFLATGCAGAAGRYKGDGKQTDAALQETTAQAAETSGAEIAEDGEYTSKEEVAEYLHRFGHLPDNFITKSEAKDLGWVSTKGNLWDVAPGKSIGGDRFGNREGLLPDAKGRKYFECDIGYQGGRRNSERIIYSNDGLIYYTEDHYNSFELLYGDD